MRRLTYSHRLTAAAAMFAVIGLGSASAAQLTPGEYSCAGSGGRTLIGLGFDLQAGGVYTDLDGTTSGRVSYSGSNVSFVGGHLAGQVGRNVTASTFDLQSASCSLN